MVLGEKALPQARTKQHVCVRCSFWGISFTSPLQIRRKQNNKTVSTPKQGDLFATCGGNTIDFLVKHSLRGSPIFSQQVANKKKSPSPLQRRGASWSRPGGQELAAQGLQLVGLRLLRPAASSAAGSVVGISVGLRAALAAEKVGMGGGEAQKRSQPRKGGPRRR